MGVLAVMGQSGDTKMLWNPENEAEVEAAEADFLRIANRTPVGPDGYILRQ